MNKESFRTKYLLLHLRIHKSLKKLFALFPANSNYLNMLMCIMITNDDHNLINDAVLFIDM